MSLSPFIDSQSPIRAQKNSVELTAIVEEAPPTRKKSSIVTKKRLGVTDLRIPRALQRPATVQDDSDDWRLTLPGSPDIFEFPRPPSSGSRSTSARTSWSGTRSLLSMPTTPAASPTTATYPCVARYKNIKPLTVIKRAEFPRPPSSSGSSSGHASTSGSDSGNVSSVPTTPAASPTAETHPCVVRCTNIRPLTIVKRAVSPPMPQAPEKAWEDDDEYYAAHARTFITLSPRLPPPFPALPLAPAAPSRESVVLPTPPLALPSASVRPGSAPLIRAHPPPPPPPLIITSGTGSSLGHDEASSAPRRPPPRTLLPTDALSGDYGSYAPVLSGTPPSDPRSSPLPQAIPVPLPIGTWAASEHEHEHEHGDRYLNDDAQLSPLVAPAPLSSLEDDDSEVPSPIAYAPGEDADAYSDWESSGAARRLTHASFPPMREQPLRSRWSASTLSLASAPSPPVPRSSLRRYLPSSSSSASTSKATPAPSSRPRVSAGAVPAGKNNGKRRRPLTPADVVVLRGGPPPSSSSSSSSIPASS